MLFWTVKDWILLLKEWILLLIFYYKKKKNIWWELIMSKVKIISLFFSFLIFLVLFVEGFWIVWAKSLLIVRPEPRFVIFFIRHLVFFVFARIYFSCSGSVLFQILASGPVISKSLFRSESSLKAIRLRKQRFKTPGQRQDLKKDGSTKRLIPALSLTWKIT